MNCRRAKHLLFDFIDGMSNEPLRAELDRHLGECKECERFASEMTRSLGLLHQMPVEQLDENFNWKVRLAIHRERNAVGSRSALTSAWAKAWNYRYATSAGLAFALVLVAGAATLYRTGGTGAPAGSASVERSAPEIVRGSGNTRRADPILPRPAYPWERRIDNLVSSPTSDRPAGDTPPGAIDATDARIDSVISIDLGRMTPTQQAAYIQRWMTRLQHLQSQQEPIRRR